MRLPNILQLALLIFIVGSGYSVEALRCYVCSSDKLAICATLQTQKKTLPSELCPPDTESCFTRIENGVTIRGCLAISTVVPNNEDNYEKCEDDKCNGDIFPEDRLHCLHCAGSSCVNQADTIDVRHPCVNYDRNDKCYSIFSPDGKIAYRGCISEPQLSLGNAYCKEHIQQCAECSTSGCNNKPLEWSKEKLSCIKCKSVDGKKCDEIDDDLPPEECAPVVDGYENECYTYTGKDGLERGCLYEASLNVQKKCIDEDSCTLCKDSGCNNVHVPVEWNDESFQVEGPSKQSEFKNCYAGELEPGKPFDKKTCKNSRDSCFTYIDGDKIVKGCKLEYLQDHNLPPGFFESLPKAIHDICEQSLCNSQDINQLECFECESKSGSDPKCVSGENLKSKKCTLEMIPTKCYHYIDDVSKITQRGCMSDLKTVDMLNECKKNGEKCKKCDYGRCNMKPEYEKCLTCDAGSTACNTVQCTDHFDQCYSHLKELDVRRGCLSAAKIDHPNLNIVQDCQKDKSVCKLCSGKINCNSESALKEQCIVCDSEKEPRCIANPIESMKAECPPTLEAIGCFASLKAQTGVIRGCMKSLSTEEQKNCQGDSKTCKSCIGNSCNDKLNFYTCHSCDSAKDPKCLISPDDDHHVVCANSKKCYTKIVNGVVKRGCVGDTIVPLAEKCTGPLCVTCDDKMNCNNKPIQEEKCIKCDTKNDGVECQNNPKKFFGDICGLEPSKTEGCYVSIVGDQYERGCLSKLSQNDKEKCLSQSSTCKSFYGSNSNDVPYFQECYKCNSRDDPNCSNKLTVYATTETCEIPTATCTTGVDKYGVTHRRCSKDKSVEEKSFKHYETCEGPKCNGGIFPKDRLQCYRCSGDSDCDLPDGSDKIEKIQCSMYSELDECYNYMDNDGKMHRGCMSESTPGRMLCNSDPSKCDKCKQSGCNNRPKLKNPALSCVHCGDDKDCAYGQDKSKSKACTEMVPYNLKEACYARTIPDKKSFERGCSVDFAKKNPDVPEKALGALCFESGCNAQNIIINQCQQCSSKLGGDCSIIKGKNLSVKCDKSSYPYDKRGCFTYVKDDQVERGCVMNLKIDREKCLKDPVTCAICETNDCNNEDRNKVERSFGHRMTSTILLNVFAAFLLFWY